jgi:predicted alpha/beta superfamily hydrolase
VDSAEPTLIVIKSDRLNRLNAKLPVAGQTVRVKDRAGLYTVLNVDRERRTADVQPWGTTDVEQNVPYAEIREVSGQTLHAIRQFLAT